MTITTETASGILDSIDRYGYVIVGFNNPLPENIITIDSTYLNAWYTILDTYSEYITSTMVGGQSAITSILSQFRISSFAKSISSGIDDTIISHVFYSPLTIGESICILGGLTIIFGGEILIADAINGTIKELKIVYQAEEE